MAESDFITESPKDRRNAVVSCALDIYRAGSTRKKRSVFDNNIDNNDINKELYEECDSIVTYRKFLYHNLQLCIFDSLNHFP